MKIIIGVAAVFTLSLAINWIYQVIRKPSELFFPVSGTLYKTPSETWRQYAPIDGRPPFVKRSLNDGEKVKIAAIDPDFV